MSRSIKKGPYIDPRLFVKIEKHMKGDIKGVIKTKSRSSTILPIMEGMTFEVHNGKDYVRVHIVNEMIGKKLGAFSPTRKPAKHSDKTKK
jgi:small subunit ribosomal protein S19